MILSLSLPVRFLLAESVIALANPSIMVLISLTTEWGGVGGCVDFGWGGWCLVCSWFRFAAKVQDCFVFFVECVSGDFVVEGFFGGEVCYLGGELRDEIFFVDVKVVFVDVVVDNKECVFGVDGKIVEVLHAVVHRGVPDFEIVTVEDCGVGWVGVIADLGEVVDIEVDNVGGLGSCISIG